MKNTYLYILSVLLLCGCGLSVENEHAVNTLPDIYPDYTGVTIPVNIGPMNFAMSSDAYDGMSVLFRTSKGTEIEVQGENCIDIDSDDWKQLMQECVNDSLQITVRARKDNAWESFRTFSMYVMPDSIDYGIIYRRIAPGYQTFSKMGIYEYSLSDLSETTTFENTEITNACVNCHTTCTGNPNRQSFHVRGKNGGTVLITDGDINTYNTKIPDVTVGSAVYPYWHPSGDFIAYSTNNIHQSFHTTPDDVMDAYDINSDLYVYDLKTNNIILSEVLMDSTKFETNPCFSPDGRTLYFCRAERMEMPENIRDIRYDLCKVDFDPAAGKIGEKIDTVICASCDSMSVSMPRVSNDGNYLIYCKALYGGSPFSHHESDLWILDLKTGENRCMTEVNSPDFTDAFHNWSSNDRWMVFGSRREDGTHTRPFITYVDNKGIGRKPFLMPQHNPKVYYAELMMSYNCVEFVTAPCDVPTKAVATKLLDGENQQWTTRKN